MSQLVCNVALATYTSKCSSFRRMFKVWYQMVDSLQKNLSTPKQKKVICAGVAVEIAAILLLRTPLISVSSSREV